MYLIVISVFCFHFIYSIFNFDYEVVISNKTVNFMKVSVPN